MKNLERAVVDWAKAKLRENELLLADDWSKVPREEFVARHKAVVQAGLPLLRVGMALIAKGAK